MSNKSKTSIISRIWKYRHFYVFISPFFILFAIFGLYPLIFSFYLSFVKWDGLTKQRWVGFANFINMFHDDVFFTCLWNTFVIGVMYIPLMLILAFVFALILNSTWLKCRGIFRAAFFLPCVTPMVVIAIVFQLLYGQEAGVLNFVITKIGEAFPSLQLKAVPWLVSEHWSKASVAILVVGRWTGYNMVLMLAGLQGISKQYYEAARLDGAGIFHQTWHITLPLMRPVFVFCGIMSIIGTVYMFDEIFVLTQGGPGSSSTNFGLYLFNTSFNEFRFGRASCMAYTVALVVFITSLFILKFRQAPTD